MSSLPALEESKILVPVDVTREDGIALRLGQTVQMHLLVEEVDHLLLVEAEWKVSNVNSSGLPCD